MSVKTIYHNDMMEWNVNFTQDASHFLGILEIFYRYVKDVNADVPTAGFLAYTRPELGFRGISLVG